MSLANLASSHVSPEKVAEHLRNKLSVKKWVENTLDINGKLSDDFFKTFQNGVFLCYLMLELDDRSIPRIQENTNIAFKQKENISFFIHAAREYGVPNYRLFSISDLYDGKNIAYVVECLYALGQAAKTKHFFHVIPDFPNSGSTSDEALLKKLSDTEFKSLQVQLSKLKSETSTKKRPAMSSLIVKKKMELIAGNPRDYQRMEKGFQLLQALYRGHLARDLKKKRVHGLATRENIAKEILETEKSYHQGLINCITYFMNPLTEAANSKSPIIEKEKIHMIFSDVVQIASLSESLLQTLEPVVSSWGPNSKIGFIFLKIADFLKIYRNYIGNFDKAVPLLQKLEKNKKFQKWYSVACKEPKLNKLQLPDFLIMPIQRVPRYELLIRELVKYTWNEHPDMNDLKEASKKMAVIGKDLNQQKNNAEHFSALTKISKLLEGRPVVIQFGDTIVACEVFKDPKNKEVQLILLNDKLIYGFKTHRDKITLALINKAPIYSMKWVEDYRLSEIDIVYDDQTHKLQVSKNKKPIPFLNLTCSEGHCHLVTRFEQMKKIVSENTPVIQKESKEEIVAPDLKGAEEQLKQRRATMRSANNSPQIPRKSHTFSQPPPLSHSADVTPESNSPSLSPLPTLKGKRELKVEIDQLSKEIKKTKDKEEKHKLEQKRDSAKESLKGLEKNDQRKSFLSSFLRLSPKSDRESKLFISDPEEK